MEQVFIMVHNFYLVIVKPNPKQNKSTVGYLMLRIKHKEVWETVIDKSDRRNLRIFMMSR